MKNSANTAAAAALYASIGEELVHYALDARTGLLERRESVRLPANVQYAWPHPGRRFLYVATSPRGPGEGGASGGNHHLCAYRIDARTGALSLHGDPKPLPYRPIHVSLDAAGRYALTAYNEPSGLTVHRVNDGGTLGEAIAQRGDLDTGIYAHQVLAAPSDDVVILVTRGNSATAQRPEDPGALKLFRFEHGVLSNLASVAPHGGYGFGPRHIDFHPKKPWIYVSLERQNRLELFTLEGERVSATASYSVPTLEAPGDVRPRQLAGTVHVHPNGRYVYVANRADGTVDFEGRPVFGGGENSILVCAIDPGTGEPKPIQHADPESFHVRTFALAPDAGLLVAASTKALAVREAGGVRERSAALSVFRVGDDGRLELLRRHDVHTGGKLQFWMGIVALPADAASPAS
jgi:6-phosphogluconolactonase